MKKQEKNISKISTILKEHLNNNIKAYVIVSIIFLIGIMVGIVFINNANEEQRLQIQEHLNSFTQSLNSEYRINKASLFRTSIIQNILLAIAIWFIGSTVIGIPIVFVIVAIKGFSLGYTISSIMITYPIFKGILFSTCTLFLQNIIYIPCIIALAVSGIRLYKSIIKDKRRENIRIEILRHTISSSVVTFFLIAASLIEAYFSSSFLTLTIKMFA